MRGYTERCRVPSKWIGGRTTGSNNNNVKEIKLTLWKKIALSSLPSINLKLYSGATHHFQKIGSTDLPQQPTSNYNTEARVIVPNGASMISSVTTHLPIPSFPPSDTKYYNFNHLSSGSLFSVGQAFNNNCTAVFDKNYVKLFKSTEVNMNALRPTIIQGHRNEPS